MKLNKYRFTLENIDTGKETIVNEIASFKTKVVPTSNKAGTYGQERLQKSVLAEVKDYASAFNDDLKRISNESPLGKKLLEIENIVHEGGLFTVVGPLGKVQNYRVIIKTIVC